MRRRSNVPPRPTQQRYKIDPIPAANEREFLEKIVAGASNTGKVLRDDGTWVDSPVIENRTDDPESPVSGQIWLRTDL